LGYAVGKQENPDEIFMFPDPATFIAGSCFQPANPSGIKLLTNSAFAEVKRVKQALIDSIDCSQKGKPQVTIGEFKQTLRVALNLFSSERSMGLFYQQAIVDALKVVTEWQKGPRDTILVVHNDQALIALIERQAGRQEVKILVASPQDAQGIYQDNKDTIGAIITGSAGENFVRGVKAKEPSIPVVGFSKTPEFREVINTLPGGNGFVVDKGDPLASVIRCAKENMQQQSGSRSDGSRWTDIADKEDKPLV
jgi:hypothetical protein